MSKLTPNLIVDAIEPCLPFWESLGFTRKVTVPHEDKIGFVILAKDELELMIQSRASVADDVPQIARGAYRTVIYLEVPDLDAAYAQLRAAEVLIEGRSTFYGARESVVRDPAGNIVFIAQHVVK